MKIITEFYTVWESFQLIIIIIYTLSFLPSHYQCTLAKDCYNFKSFKEILIKEKKKKICHLCNLMLTSWVRRAELIWCWQAAGRLIFLGGLYFSLIFTGTPATNVAGSVDMMRTHNWSWKCTVYSVINYKYILEFCWVYLLICKCQTNSNFIIIHPYQGILFIY